MMLRWLNPRVIVVVLSVMALVEVSSSPTPQILAKHAIYTCPVMAFLYVLVFLVPVRRAVRPLALLGLLISLLLAWTATGLALIADAFGVTPDDQLRMPWNWSRTAFVIAAGIAFYLFFNGVTRALAARDEMSETGQRPV